MKNAEAVLSVKFNSTLSMDELAKVSNDELENFRNVPGLLQKYYLADEVTGAISGIYLFTSKKARTSFWNSDLAKSIPATYGIIPETLRVEEYNTMIVLYEDVIA